MTKAIVSALLVFIGLLAQAIVLYVLSPMHNGTFEAMMYWFVVTVVLDFVSASVFLSTLGRGA